MKDNAVHRKGDVDEKRGMERESAQSKTKMTKTNTNIKGMLNVCVCVLLDVRRSKNGRRSI